MNSLKIILISAFIIHSFTGKKILDKDRDETIAIIGAGIAGLSAGYILKQNNIKSVIFEASNVSGGRTQSISINKGIDEIGGKEISDGGDAVYLRYLANKLHVPLIDINKPHTIRYYINGKKGSFYDFTYLLRKIINENTPVLNSYELERSFKNNPILYSALKTRIQCYEGADSHLLSESGYISAIERIISTTLERSPDEFSQTAGIRKSTEFENGTNDFIQKLAKGQNILYGYELLKIEEQKNQYVLIFLNGERRTVKKVVFAVPLPKLKELVNDNKISSPSFSENLKSVEMGNNTKIIIPIVETKDNIEFGVFSKYITWFNRSKTSITLYFGGKAADVSIKEEYENIRRDLNQIYEASKFDWDVKTWSVTKWNDNPLYKGSYSFPSKCNSENYEKTVQLKDISIRNLFKPQRDKLYFVGEHVSVENPGTMEGAVESSVKMMNLLQKK